jgi:tRNA uridine 5-carbamoylmethylation protein Kti12
VYDMKIYVSVRNRKDRAKTPSKRIVTFNKSTQQILQQKIEHFIDETGDFEFIYMETFVPVLEELAYCFIDKKSLSYMLSCDITCDY